MGLQRKTGAGTKKLGTAAIPERGPCGLGGEGRGSHSFGRVNRREPHGLGGEEKGERTTAVLKEKREDHEALV